MLPPEAITEFKEIYLKIYHIQLSDEEAAFRANNLVNLYKFVLDPAQIETSNEIDYEK